MTPDSTQFVLPDVTTVDVIGLRVAVTNYVGAIEWIRSAAMRGDRAYAVEAANTHVAALARHDEDFGRVMARFDLIVPDGMPLVWAVNRHLDRGEVLKDRVYGPELMLKTLEASRGDAELKHFFLGGRKSTLDQLEKRFAQDCPEAVVCGSYAPPFGEWPEGESERICDKIRDSGACLVWVGLGCPKQEQWIANNKDRLPPAVYFGIGAAFAFHAGEQRQAPSFIQRIGCEWMFRLLMEPRRLMKRYLTYNSLFLYYMLRGELRG